MEASVNTGALARLRSVADSLDAERMVGSATDIRETAADLEDAVRLLTDMADSVRRRSHKYHVSSGHTGDIRHCHYERCEEAASLMERFADLEERAAQ